MDAVKYFEIKKRMTRNCSIECCKCDIDPVKHGEEEIGCITFEMTYPEKAVAIAEKWDKEHTKKTCAQVFFERFPDAKKHENSETPMICVKTVGLSDLGHICPCGNIIDCCKCWNSPAPDKYQD